MRKSFKAVLLSCVTSVGLVTGIAPMVSAAPAGTSVDGCQAQIFNTAFYTKCVNVSSSGNFHTKAWCTSQPTINAPKVWVKKGSSVSGISSGACTFNVHNGQTYKS